MGSLIRDTGAPYVRRSHLDSATYGSQQIGLGGRLKQRLTGGEFMFVLLNEDIDPSISI